MTAVACIALTAINCRLSDYAGFGVGAKTVLAISTDIEA